MKDNFFTKKKRDPYNQILTDSNIGLIKQYQLALIDMICYPDHDIVIRNYGGSFVHYTSMLLNEVKRTKVWLDAAILNSKFSNLIE